MPCAANHLATLGPSWCQDSAGTDDDGSARLCPFRREIGPQFRIDDVQDAFADLTGVHGGGIFEEILLLGPILGTGSLALIKAYLFRLCKQGGSKQGKDK